MDVILRTANVHSDPTKSSTVLATLPRDAKITPLEQRGNWVLVAIDSGDALHTTRKGWIYNSYLGPVPPPSAVRP
jgi:uncharacterized protein YgiM (DUF1202 family)